MDTNRIRTYYHSGQSCCIPKLITVICYRTSYNYNFAFCFNIHKITTRCIKKNRLYRALRLSVFATYSNYYDNYTRCWSPLLLRVRGVCYLRVGICIPNCIRYMEITLGFEPRSFVVKKTTLCLWARWLYHSFVHVRGCSFYYLSYKVKRSVTVSSMWAGFATLLLLKRRWRHSFQPCEQAYYTYSLQLNAGGSGTVSSMCRQKPKLFW